jgi:hypothetical protein
MHQKLLQKAGLLGLMIVAVGYVLSGCIDEPNPPVIEKLTSKVRFVHADESTGPVDLWIDGFKTVSNLSFKNFQDYLDVKSGIRLIQLTSAGQSDTVGALFAQQTSIRSLTQMTIFFYPGQDGLTSYIAQEKFTYANEELYTSPDSCRVKVINLFNRPVVFSKGSGGETLIPEVAAGTLTPYRNFIAGQALTVSVTAAGAPVTETQFNPVSKKRYTFFLMGSTAFLLVMNDISLPTYP